MSSRLNKSTQACLALTIAKKTMHWLMKMGHDIVINCRGLEQRLCFEALFTNNQLILGATKLDD